MATLVKGFAVGRGQMNYRSDGTSWSRPRLVEVEAEGGVIVVAVADGIVWLDREAAEAARDLLNDAIEAVS